MFEFGFSWDNGSAKFHRVKAECPPWSSTPEIRRARLHRDLVHRKAVKSKLASDWDE